MPSKSQPVKQAHRILSGRGSQQYLLEPPRESDSEFESNPVVEEFDDPSDDDYICPESVEHDENEDPDEDLDEELPKEIPSLKRKSSEKGLSQSKKHRGHTQSSQSGNKHAPRSWRMVVLTHGRGGFTRAEFPASITSTPTPTPTPTATGSTFEALPHTIRWGGGWHAQPIYVRGDAFTTEADKV